MPKIKILFADQEQNNFNAFVAYFRRKKNYEVLPFYPKEQLPEIIENIAIDILIIDETILEALGFDLLYKIDRSKMIIIATTASREIDLLELAYKDGQIFQYFCKPFDMEELNKAIQTAIPKQILYIDLDDTMVNYSEAHARNKTDVLRHPQSIQGFFENLEAKEGAIQAYHTLSELYDVWILSAPSVRNPLCYTEKRLWVEKNLGQAACWKLILSPNKSLLKGHYLIDDHLHPGFEGKHIHFGSSGFPNWKAVVSLLSEH